MKVEVRYKKTGRVERMEERYANVLVKLGHVERTVAEPEPSSPAQVAPAPEPQVTPVEAVVDLVETLAEPSADLAPNDAEGVEISARTGKPKRQYRRRDLQADDQ